MKSQPAAPTARLTHADGLRGLAILMVVAYHLNPASPILRGGYIGLDIFFPLSGFLITRKLLAAADTRLSAFYANRCGRLLPGLLLAVLVAIPATAVAPAPYRSHWLGVQIAAALTGTYNFLMYMPSAPRVLNSTLLVCWSLAVEEQFYWLWPVILRRMGRRGALHRLPRWLLVLSALSFGLIFLEASFWSSSNLFYHSELRAGELLLGCLVGMAPASDVRRQGVARLAVALFCGAFALGTLAEDALLSACAIYLTAIATTLLLSCAELSRISRLLERVLGRRELSFVAQVSYEWYLLHLPVAVLIARSLGTSLLTMALTVILGLSVSAAVHFRMSRPLGKRIRALGPTTTSGVASTC